MQKVSVSLADRHLDRLDDIQRRDDVNSRSAAVRTLIDEYDDIHTEYDELQTECERLRTECDRLKNEKRLILEQREEKAELARYVNTRKQIEQAPIWTRAKWKLLGRPDERE